MDGNNYLIVAGFIFVPARPGVLFVLTHDCAGRCQEMGEKVQERKRKWGTVPVPRLTVTIEQAHLASGLCTRTIYHLLDDGRLKSVKVGKRRLVIWSSLVELCSIRASGEDAPGDIKTRDWFREGENCA
jgi:hypothetical protein